ncbi:MAG: insulinase family protein [Gammaproteobacteria bacterium]|nr:insulinase family protein [Gammaproteobacteria bacterium]MCW9003972.1 insulinase family protein [Gammaproteobacteria bacterium]MCW9055680.1 insulinase family protein [Gammaproteobacteria bacterium]
MTAVALQPHNTHPSFEWLRSEPVESLNLVVEEYRHIKTGALHYHLAADFSENVFLVALRTVPIDSKGVAHILEHTALCGSQHYPVRDPFFMMIRRSLNTFMNAFTSSDWTAYPFASQNRKDFNNLMDVYLDAVFFSTLDELDFAQEGHRYEFETPDDASTNLVYKGVVFNEMKGAMSSSVSTLWQTLTEHLYPTTTYHYNSGGDPEDIPDLSYAELIAFYKKHYHPSNAVFMTFGDIPAYEHQQKFEDRALSQFTKLDEEIQVEKEQRYTEPKRVEDSYASDEEDTSEKTHIVLAWLLGESSSLLDMLRAHLMSSVLLDNSASPLRYQLERTDLGTAPSPMCGLEDSNREMSFMCGVEGSNPENTIAVEELVINTLQDVVEKGVPQERVEAVLHQLELGQREIGGDGYPFGLQLILNGLPAAIHRGDPVAVLNLDPVLEQLREDIQNPDFIKNLVRTHLLDNQHRLTLTMKPDKQLSQKREKAEADKLAVIKQQLSPEETQNIIEIAAKLLERQNTEDDPDVLPKVGLQDIPAELHVPEGSINEINGLPVNYYEQGTNGLIYQQVIINLPQLDNDLLDVLPYYTYCLTELGCADNDYLSMQDWQSKVSGGVNAYTSTRGQIDNVQSISGHFVLSAKALARNHQELNKLMQQTLEAVRFDEYERIRELIAQKRASREQSITGHGHSLAMTAACSGMSPGSALSHRLDGLAGIEYIKQLDDDINQQSSLINLAEKFQAIHSKVLSSARQYLLIAEEDLKNQLEDDIANIWPVIEQVKSKDFTLPEINKQIKQAWITSTQVNFCAKAYQTVPVEHDDAPALAVLGGFLRNGFLHRVIREQGGAYGGGASHDSANACFRFYSYRDPRFIDTFNDFDRSIDWLLTADHEYRQLEEAILGVISSMDKPGSPAGEAKQAFHNNLYGRSKEQRQRFRQKVINVTIDDLKRVGETYLQSEKASIAVVTNKNHEKDADQMGMDINRL